MTAATTVRDDARDELPPPGWLLCPACGALTPKVGRQRYCCAACRQKAHRDRQRTPPPPPRRRATSVYECGECGERQIGQQRCNQCGIFGRRIGTGNPCPHCDEPVTIEELTS